jgi:predicted nucleic acid-binding Zn ribbon protein
VSAKRRKDIAPIRSLLDAVVGRMDPDGRRYESEVVAAWGRVCGDEIAGHTLGHSFSDGELLVFVDTAAWANELSLMAEEMRRRLGEAVPQVSVTSIRFVVSRRVSDAARAEAEERRASSSPAAGAVAAPLSRADANEIERATRDIADPDVRAAASELMRRDLEWKRGLERESSEDPDRPPESGREKG